MAFSYGEAVQLLKEQSCRVTIVTTINIELLLSLKLTAKAPEKMAFPKGNSSSNHPFSGVNSLASFQGAYPFLLVSIPGISALSEPESASGLGSPKVDWPPGTFVATVNDPHKYGFCLAAGCPQLGTPSLVVFRKATETLKLTKNEDQPQVATYHRGLEVWTFDPWHWKDT